jgi:hypothetical protein
MEHYGGASGNTNLQEQHITSPIEIKHHKRSSVYTVEVNMPFWSSVLTLPYVAYLVNPEANNLTMLIKA